jgi:hypothetical protein
MNLSISKATLDSTTSISDWIEFRDADLCQPQSPTTFVGNHWLSFQRTRVQQEKSMRHPKSTWSALTLLLLLHVSFASDKQRFDGRWMTTISCPAARDALGFSYKFTSTVKDGVFHGLHGTEGEPGSLQIDGTIQSDGDSSLYARGRTGSKEYVVGKDTPVGTDYGYNIEAHFGDASGSGTRLEGRPCTLKFVKQ